MFQDILHFQCILQHIIQYIFYVYTQIFLLVICHRMCGKNNLNKLHTNAWIKMHILFTNRSFQLLLRRLAQNSAVDVPPPIPIRSILFFCISFLESPLILRADSSVWCLCFLLIQQEVFPAMRSLQSHPILVHLPSVHIQWSTLI